MRWSRLHLAADLARRHKSRITALFDPEWSVPQYDQQGIAELGLASAQVIQRANLEILGRDRSGG